MVTWIIFQLWFKKEVMHLNPVSMHEHYNGGRQMVVWCLLNSLFWICPACFSFLSSLSFTFYLMYFKPAIWTFSIISKIWIFWKLLQLTQKVILIFLNNNFTVANTNHNTCEGRGGMGRGTWEVMHNPSRQNVAHSMSKF